MPRRAWTHDGPVFPLPSRALRAPIRPDRIKRLLRRKLILEPLSLVAISCLIELKAKFGMVPNLGKAHEAARLHESHCGLGRCLAAHRARRASGEVRDRLSP